MLALPETGVRYSVGAHNSSLEAICDWVEASITFGNESEISSSDIVDILTENDIYNKQDFCWEFIHDVFSELERRTRIFCRGIPYAKSTDRVSAVARWQELPAFSFCLMLSLAQWYPTWYLDHQDSWQIQGYLFERLSEAALNAQYEGWTFQGTGWTPEAGISVEETIVRVANIVGDTVNDISRATKVSDKDLGLDLIGIRRYPDRRIGFPVLLGQCASGKNWEDKAKGGAPDPEFWMKLIQFSTRPTRFFIMPYMIAEDLFVRSAIRTNGLFVDRTRLLAASAQDGEGWLKGELRRDLVLFTERLVELLPAGFSAV